jgi:replicative DNA helicase
LKTIARNLIFLSLLYLTKSKCREPRIKKPILSDLRESGSIEQDADLVIMLYRSKYYNLKQNEDSLFQLIELIIAKHRNGPVGTVTLKFDEKRTKFLIMMHKSVQ